MKNYSWWDDEKCPRCGATLTDGFCGVCGFPTNLRRLVYKGRKMTCRDGV